MRNLDIAQFGYDVETIFKDCISLLNEEKNKELITYTEDVINISNEYKSFMPNFFEDITHCTINDNGKTLLIDLYNFIFVAKKNNLISDYYSNLLILAKGICPFCDRQPSKTLDHFLPKSIHPLLVVTPENLVPCCRDCNLNKKDYNPKSNNEVLIHPYFDKIDFVWLKVRLLFGNKNEVSSIFSVHPLDDLTLQSRLEKTIEKLKLDESFRCGTLTELFSVKQKYNTIYKQLGLKKLHELIILDKDSAESYDLNSYKSALYRALNDQLDEFVSWLTL